MRDIDTHCPRCQRETVAVPVVLAECLCNHCHAVIHHPFGHNTGSDRSRARKILLAMNELTIELLDVTARLDQEPEVPKGLARLAANITTVYDALE